MLHSTNKVWGRQGEDFFCTAVQQCGSSTRSTPEVRGDKESKKNPVGRRLHR